ncbi:MFS transporter [Novosphingobium guangzhouense]|uniref:Major facilitator superfamily (MFS) profile domain-containing protein n=1 Tax=Novosphingobium guangzhouense TaxID=1850347 RepID=A0A2K2FWK2_9SPHN|nr:MFS transporter [Novosphingobium guangzhouense]PNU03153.1 hypothetical protein A8V01_24715 [Novosphingobium guangzhouense]
MSLGEPYRGLAPRKRWMAAAAMWLAIGMTTIDGSITNVALPAIGAALDVSPAASIWIVNAYQIAVMMTLLPLAALGEWIGYRKVYQAGLICFVIASIGCSLSSNLEGLAICRALQGLGAGGVMSVNGALIRYIYPQSRVARGIGYNALVVAIASAAGPTVAAVLLRVAEWPILFAINLPIGALSLLAGWRALPDETGGAKGFAKVQAVLCAAGLGMLALSFINLAQWRLSYATVFEATFGVAALVVLVRKQRNSGKPMLPVDLLAYPALRLAYLASLLTFAAQTMALIALPFLLNFRFGIDTFMTGLIITPWAFAVAAGALASGRISMHSPLDALATCGLLLFTLGLVCFTFVPTGNHLVSLLGCSLISGLGFGLFQTPNNRTMLASGPLERSGAAAGMQASARLTGQTIGAALMACSFHFFGAGSDAGLSMAALLAFLAALVAGLKARRAKASLAQGT